VRPQNIGREYYVTRRASDQAGAAGDRTFAEGVHQQDYLEIDTAAKVVERVRKWATTFLYFAAIPLGILVLALAVVFGKGVFDLGNIASNSKASVEESLRTSPRDCTGRKEHCG